MNHAFPAADAPAFAATPRASACPGLVRIVAARDGGICRIRLTGGTLSAHEAYAIADAAQAHASGVLEATNRANLQIRGVRAGEQSALIERLLAAGLGPAGTTDPAHTSPANAAADDVRNLMLSPTAGRDRAALVDTLPLADSILALLRSEARFATLSPKFALQLDGGERLAMLGHPHDIWLAAMPAPDGLNECNGSNSSAHEPCFAFGLAGCVPVAPHHCAALAAVRPAQVPALVRALLDAFLELAAPDMPRMRDLLAQLPAEAVLANAEARLDFALLRGPQVAAWRRPRADASLRFGAHPQRADHMSHVGGQPPLGRIDAATLRALAALARDTGNGTLRITPWQSVLLPDVHNDQAQAVLARLGELGFACDRAQPFARLIACAGSSGCAKGLADTKADAARLAELLHADAEVHLSGCARSCAAAHPVPFALLAVAPGRYDLYRRDNDGADEAARGFGACIAHHLSIEQAAGLLERPARSFPDA